MTFKKGMKVIKTLKGIGSYVETEERLIHSVKKGVVYLDSEGYAETGITYNAKTGKEIENFFPPMTSFIKPINPSK